jgi:inhibitor of KinA
MTTAFPCFRAVGDQAVLAEFGDRIDPAVQRQVSRLDHLLAQHGFAGFIEAVPAYANLLVVFDPGITDHATVTVQLRDLLDKKAPPPAPGKVQEVLVCYDADLSPDLPEVVARTGLSTDAVIRAHVSARYSVVMYGFAPGYAYLAGLSADLMLPRKAAAIRGVPAGSVLIAGGQCLVSTLLMPTGWWNIGRSPTRILRDDPAQPFLFDVGDEVRFRQIDRATFDRLGAGQ